MSRKLSMLATIKKGYYFLLEYKRKVYLDSLVRNGLQLGKNVVIMDDFFFDPGHCFLISIGDSCVLAPGVRLIAHDASTKQFLDSTKIGKIIIEQNCFIGDSVIILPGVTVGQGSVVGAGSVVTKNIPSGSVAAGNPCRVICSREEYMQRMNSLIVSRKTPFADQEQQRLTDSQKKEIKAFLESGIGYIR